MKYRIENAYAKINLYLDIKKKNIHNGYHELYTIMQSVSLHDEVYIKGNGSQKINVYLDRDIGVEDQDNIAYKAAELFYKTLKKDVDEKVDIAIVKKIPVAAGLGGGSADAGAVLRGLNHFYGKPFTNYELCVMGSQLGSDVPFCVLGGTQMCNEDGEPVYSMKGIHHYDLLIAKGDDKISTAEQYRQLDDLYNDFKDYQNGDGYVKTLISYQSGECSKAFETSFNIFETLYDENSNIAKIKAIMENNGAYFSILCGSGPSVVGVFGDRIFVEDAEKELRSLNIQTFHCFPINMTYDMIEKGFEIW